jgi:hypothetical protein
MESRVEFDQALRSIKSLGLRAENLTRAFASTNPGDAGWKPLMLEFNRFQKDFETLCDRPDVKQVLKEQFRTMQAGTRELLAVMTRTEEFLYHFSLGPDKEEATPMQREQWLKIIRDGKAAASKVFNQLPAICLPPSSLRMLSTWGEGFDLNYLHNLRKRWATEAAIEEFNAALAPKPTPTNPVLEEFASDAMKNSRISELLEQLVQK